MKFALHCYNSIKDTSQITHSIIHEHKHRVLYLRVWRAHTHIRNSQPYQLTTSTREQMHVTVPPNIGSETHSDSTQ